MNAYDQGSKEHAGSGEDSPEPRKLTAAQRFFLARIDRLLRLHDEYQSLLRPEDWESRLLTKATYSTYCDCVQLGVGAEARERLAAKGMRAG